MVIFQNASFPSFVQARLSMPVGSTVQHEFRELVQLQTAWVVNFLRPMFWGEPELKAETRSKRGEGSFSPAKGGETQAS